MFIIGFAVFLVIMIETADTISNASLVSLGVTLFLNLNLSYRFSINNVRLMETQLVSISKIWNITAPAKPAA